MHFLWTEECEEALGNLKTYLSSVPILSKPKPGEDLYLYFAVSQHAISTALVRQEGQEQLPIYFSSKSLISAETKYLSLEIGRAHV